MGVSLEELNVGSELNLNKPEKTKVRDENSLVALLLFPHVGIFFHMYFTFFLCFYSPSLIPVLYDLTVGSVYKDT